MSPSLSLANGITFADLYSVDGARRIDALFVAHLQASDDALAGRFALRSAGRGPRPCRCRASFVGARSDFAQPVRAESSYRFEFASSREWRRLLGHSRRFPIRWRPLAESLADLSRATSLQLLDRQRMLSASGTPPTPSPVVWRQHLTNSANNRSSFPTSSNGEYACWKNSYVTLGMRASALSQFSRS